SFKKCGKVFAIPGPRIALSVASFTCALRTDAIAMVARRQPKTTRRIFPHERLSFIGPHPVLSDAKGVHSDRLSSCRSSAYLLRNVADGSRKSKRRSRQRFFRLSTRTPSYGRQKRITTPAPTCVPAAPMEALTFADTS